MGMQNALLLVGSPVGIFISSLLVTGFELEMASYVLIGALWIFIVVALGIKSMRNLNDIG